MTMDDIRKIESETQKKLSDVNSLNINKKLIIIRRNHRNTFQNMNYVQESIQ